MRKFLLVLFPLLLMSAENIPLMQDGKPVCSILLNLQAGPVEKHAALELSKYLGKIAGGEVPQIDGKLYPIRYELTQDENLATDGFTITTSPKECVVKARIPLGFLYGSYEILKRYAGIRWLVPGSDGEYFKVKPTITIPCETLTVKPSFKFRTINWGGASILSAKWDSLDWMVRNNLTIYDNSYVYFSDRTSPPSKDTTMTAEMEKRGSEIMDGGHCFSDLLSGWRLPDETSGKLVDSKNVLEALFTEHPEYFPEIEGQRVFLEGHRYQPCTTHPDVIRIMGKNLAQNFILYSSKTPRGEYRLVNNDGTGWCQCEQCRKDDPKDVQISGTISRRYWSFVNALAKEARKTAPNIRLRAIAYQNFQEVPKGIEPDPEFMIDLSFNRICYRHKIDDPNCLTNRLYFRMYNEWSKMKNPLTAYAQIDSAAGGVFMPIEETFTHALKFYHRIGITGIRPQFSPVDGTYSSRYAGSSMYKEAHYAMWQAVYLMCLYAWDINTDYEDAYEESNSYYYGAGWAGGMSDFRKLLIKTASETPGCFGHGHSSALGRCLEKPLVKERLLQYLASAEKAAAEDPDPRSLKHVLRDKGYFMQTWVRFNDDYQKNYREICSYRRMQPIVIDGSLDELDWKNADVVSGFKLTNLNNEPAKDQTFVRIVHEPDNIYFGIEALEPEPDKLATKIEDYDGDVWKDNTLEIMISHPDLGTSFYHFIFNTAGVCYDRFVRPGSPADRDFNAHPEVKTKILSDRWILEVRIPSDKLGEKCFDGQAWKVNVLRSRKIIGKIGSSGTATEASTWSSGNGHAVELFHPVNFCPERKITISGDVVDTRLWRNGSLDEKAAKPYTGGAGWKIAGGVMPAFWAIAGNPGELALLEEEKDSGRYFLHMKKATVINEYYGKAGNTLITFRHRGSGSVTISWWLYEVKNGQRKHQKGIVLGKFAGSDDWKLEKLDVELPQADLVKLAISVDGEADIDAISVTAKLK